MMSAQRTLDPIDSEIDKITFSSSITAIILREVRLDLNVNQAYAADNLNMPQSTFAKVETGKSRLTVDMLFRLSSAYNVSPAAVLHAVEQYSMLLRNWGWIVLSAATEADSEKDQRDILMPRVNEYYKRTASSLRYQLLSNGVRVGVLNTPLYEGFNQFPVIADVFRDAGDFFYKELFL